MHRFGLLLTAPVALAAAVVVQLSSPSEALAGHNRPGPKPSPTATATPTPTATATPTPTATPSATPPTLFTDSFSSLPLGVGWIDDSTHGGWVSTYNGYGSNGVDVDGSQVLTESPAVSTSAGVTHASLVNTTASFGDMDTTVRMRTVKQLRLPAPNAWEVAWVLWHYTDDTHFYYLALKPNGWELGKEDPAYPGAQRYLRTSSSPSFAVASWHTMRIRQIGNVITVWGDGAQLASFTDNERPYAAGSLGLYNEDSLVHFDDVQVAKP